MTITTGAHIPKKSFLLACKICEQGNPAVYFDIHHSLKDDIEKLINLRALIADNKNWIEDENGNYQEVINRDNKFGYFNLNQQWTEVCNNSITIHKINFNWIVNLISSDLVIDKYPSDILINDIFWRVGTLSPEIPIFFARRLSHQENFEEIYKILEARKGTKKGIILTTSSELPFGCSRLLGHEVISFRDCLVHDSKNFKIDQDILRALVDIGIKKEGFSVGYRTAYIDGKEYSFSKKQAAIVEALHKHGGKMNKHELLAEADSEQYDVYRIFRSNNKKHPALDTIIKNDSKGNYWLDA